MILSKTVFFLVAMITNYILRCQVFDMLPKLSTCPIVRFEVRSQIPSKATPLFDVPL